MKYLTLSFIILKAGKKKQRPKNLYWILPKKGKLYWGYKMKENIGIKFSYKTANRILKKYKLNKNKNAVNILF